MKQSEELALANRNRDHMNHVAIIRLRRPTIFERVSGCLSFFDSAESPELMPELSDERDCFRCGHPWMAHGGEKGCRGHVWVMTSHDEHERHNCRCSRQKQTGAQP